MAFLFVRRATGPHRGTMHFVASVNIILYPVREVLEYSRDVVPRVLRCRPGGTQGSQNRTGVSLNRGYDLLALLAAGSRLAHSVRLSSYIPALSLRADDRRAMPRSRSQILRENSVVDAIALDLEENINPMHEASEEE